MSGSGEPARIIPPSWVACLRCGQLDYTAFCFCSNTDHPVADRPLYAKIPWDWEPVLNATYRLGGLDAAREAVVALRSP